MDGAPELLLAKAKRRKNGFAFVKMLQILAFFQYILAKKAADKKSAAFVCMCLRNLCLKNQTVRFLRPLARRRASTLRPFLEAMRFKKP